MDPHMIKYLTLIATLSVLSLINLSAQNQPPVVENVIFNQRTDGSSIVDIYYDVQNPTGHPMALTMEVSDDNGATWNFPCVQITGDVGSGITSGTNKHIVWNFGAEHQQTFGDQFRIKIIADDGGFNTGIPCPGEPTVLYEGRTYHTVLIGNQCWLRENLNVGTRIDGNQDQTNNVPTNIIEKYCYDNLEANCDADGGLYQWAEALQYQNGATNISSPDPPFTENVQGICPPGWHVPALIEFQTLASAVNNDGNSLKREDQAIGLIGQGTNTTGFSAILAGGRYVGGETYYFLGVETVFWSATEDFLSYANNRVLSDASSEFPLGEFYKFAGFSIRCLKD
jgi:uncharacterized protein (TIGR02145 family)